MPRASVLTVLVAWVVGCGSTPADDRGVDASGLFDGGVEAGVEAGVDATAPVDADTDGPTDVDAGDLLDLGACGLAAADPGDSLAVAACNAIGPFARGEFLQPLDLLLGDIPSRRFGIDALDNLWSAYQRALAAEPTTQLRVYARVGDASVRVSATDLASVGSVDVYTAPALHCRDHALPSNYAQILAGRAVLGGYEVTHVLMALMMLDDQGCQSPTDAAFYESVVAATAALIDTYHFATTDLEIEAAVFLAYVGEARRIPAGFLEGVIANQQAGGGWSLRGEGDPVNGHTTGLALWYLHESLFPESTHPMVNPNVRTP